jgi:bidirectional [NiFe] hydrogenase diaphorase subunit
MTFEGLMEAQGVEQERQQGLKGRIMCCTAAGCISCGGEQVRQALASAIKAQGNQDELELRGTGCMGLCGRGPLVRTSVDGAVYTEVTTDDASALLEGSNHLAARRVTPENPFYARQQRVVLANAGLADPEVLLDNIAVGAYSALARALSEMTPLEVVAEVKKSGLRGRGGAGYPTGLKWELVAKQASPVKYVVCNADEGDPGAFMDRSVLEGDPHRVLEGMAIAGYAIGAKQGYIYVRGEYGLAIQRLQNAIKQAEREHLLGARILENNFQFRIDLRIGAGAFVCGEETALIASIEGKRGQPRQRPPYPPASGLWDQPTLINNVETFANVPPIVTRGSDWFASIGIGSSKGTKVLALAGKIANTGLVEVPMGTPLRTIVYDIGGGIPSGGTFKAAQTGGPSGGCIPAEFLDLPVDYESLTRIGSIMGSGGLIVMDNSSCMVDVARFFMEFCMDESCGKCIPCRAGTVQMHDILKRMTRGQSRPGDLPLLEQLSGLLRETSLCGLGQTAPNPVVSTLRYFRQEYDAHIQDRRCPAGHCKIPDDQGPPS